MKRSRAFILSEQLMTIMLQASFILVLCASFYQLISFYTRTQQVLTARNHAERVISFMDDKIRNAGLGLWRCKSSAAIREKLDRISMLQTNDTIGYKWPVALKWYRDGTDNIPLLSISQNSGDVLTVLYAKRNLSTGDKEIITAFKTAEKLTRTTSPTGSSREYISTKVTLLDTESVSKLKDDSLFDFKSGGDHERNIKRYAVMEGLGLPLLLYDVPNASGQEVRVYVPATQTIDITIPAAGDLMNLNCMQMFVHDNNDGQGRQFAFRELDESGIKWKSTYNQEKGILDIYMEVDRMHNIFTLWVLATGGYDASMSNPRPDSWPKEAYPQGNTDEAAKAAWLDASKCDYSHHIVYVSRASWKLNNIPQGFTWD